MGKQVEENGTSRRKRRSFTREFKAEVIALVRQGERVKALLYARLIGGM